MERGLDPRWCRYTRERVDLEVIQHTVNTGDGGKKLHRYMRQLLPELPLSGVHKLLRVGRVRVNGAKGKADTVLAAGDEVQIFVREQDVSELQRARGKFSGIPDELDIVHEDADLLVVNKPVGLLTHPDSEEMRDTLIGRCLAYLYRKGELNERREFLPAAVNRLDRNTSGIVLVGKSTAVLQGLAAQIRERRVKKVYWGLVEGAVDKAGLIDQPLARASTSSGSTVAVGRNHGDVGARSARTHYRPLLSRGRYTLLEIQPESGRMHQIRAHLSEMGHPLLGDVKYGGRPAFGVNHHLLHACSLELADGRKFTCELSPVFRACLEATGMDARRPSTLLHRGS